jgi:hypothetical protein
MKRGRGSEDRLRAAITVFAESQGNYSSLLGASFAAMGRPHHERSTASRPWSRMLSIVPNLDAEPAARRTAFDALVSSSSTKVHGSKSATRC